MQRRQTKSVSKRGYGSLETGGGVGLWLAEFGTQWALYLDFPPFTFYASETGLLVSAASRH